MLEKYGIILSVTVLFSVHYIPNFEKYDAYCPLLLLSMKVLPESGLGGGG